MDTNMMKEATEYLKNLRRIELIEEAKKYEEEVLLLPINVQVSVDENSNIRTVGLNNTKDIKAKDLLRVIEVIDALNMKYKETNVLSPSSYVHSLEVKPYHITTQGFLVTKIDGKIKEYIKEENIRTRDFYGKHEMDHFWLPCSKAIDSVREDELVCIFNRRISGWDGTVERPVIELLGAGGHLQVIWSDKLKKFVSRSFEDNLKKEFNEEIGLTIKDEDINCIGGFVNSKTQELVIFSCIYIEAEKIPEIQKYAVNNFDEDTDGIYLGTFEETMKYYKMEPCFFAGGRGAAPTNFPNNKEIMRRIYEEYSVSVSN